MAELQGAAADPDERVGIEQLAQNARAALGGLVEQDQVARVAVGQRLRRQFVVLQLELDLDGVLQAPPGARPSTSGSSLEHGSNKRALRWSSTKGMTRFD